MTGRNWLEAKAFPPDLIFHFGLLSLSFLIVRIYTFEILSNLTSSILKVTEQLLKKWRKELLYFFLVTVRPCVSFEFIESIIFSWGIFLGRFSVATTIKTASKYKPLLLQCTGGSSAFTRGVGTGTFQWEWNFTDAKPVSWKTLFYAFFCNVPHMIFQCRISYQQCAF